jgi:hypothetical protein
MKENNEILDEFGKLVVNHVFDEMYKDFSRILHGTTDWVKAKEYTELFNKFNDQEKELAKKYIASFLSTTIFSFLDMFEIQSNFKLIFSEDEDADVGIDLVKLCDMLKVEVGMENGWIDRFSQELKKEKES